MKKSLLDEVVSIIHLKEKELEVGFEVDWVQFSWHPRTGYYISDKHGTTIYVPRIHNDRGLLRQYLYHELGHAYFNNYDLPNYVKIYF